MIDLNPGNDSTIRRITVLSEQLGAVNLAQGFSDEDTSEQVKVLARRAVSEGYNQYTHPRGAAILREKLAGKILARNKMSVAPDKNIVVTCGATEGMMVSMEALLVPGERILTFTPIYENFRLQAARAGIHLDCIHLHGPSFELDFDLIEEKIGVRTKALLICNPCNPTGKVYSREELTKLAAVAEKYNLTIFSDETYEYFTWEGREHVSIGSLPEGQSRTVTIFSMGKTYSVTGWRVGYVAGPGSLIDEIARVHDVHTVTAPHPLQIALSNAVDLPDAFHAHMRNEYWTRKTLLKAAFAEAGFGIPEPQGAYFLWCSYDALSSVDDVSFCEQLMLECGVAAVPGSAFFPSGQGSTRNIRLTFSKSKPTIEKAIERIRRMHARLREPVAELVVSGAEAASEQR